MNWNTNAYRPTLLSTIREIGAVSLAIWRDYRDCSRANRRRSRRSRCDARGFIQPTTAPNWRSDWTLFGVVVCLILVCAVLYVLSSTLIPFKVLP